MNPGLCCFQLTMMTYHNGPHFRRHRTQQSQPLGTQTDCSQSTRGHWGFDVVHSVSHCFAFGDRSCFVGGLVLADEVLFGAVPMQNMDLVLSTARREITVDPESPNFPHARVK